MTAQSNTEIPIIRIATEPWAERMMADTELRIERAFHDQTKMLYDKLSEQNARLNQQTLAIVLAILAVGAALVGAVFFQ